jgi:PadR family transcriptional regulator, regulatory protein AphA
MIPPLPAADEGSGDSVVPGMAAEHAILGLLALSASGTGHGYDLARQFSPVAPLGNVVRLEPGMVYHHLKKLERLGWVSAVPDSAPGRPARRLFALSSSGRTELARWLSEPVARTREIRLDFLVKLYLALQLDPSLAVRLVEEQRDLCARLVESLANRLRGVQSAEDQDSVTARFGDMVLDMRLAQTRAALAWLARVGREAATAVERAHADGYGTERRWVASTSAGPDQQRRKS